MGKRITKPKREIFKVTSVEDEKSVKQMSDG